MTPAAVGNRDTTAAVFNGLGRIYMVTDPSTAAETGLEPPPPRPSVWGKLAGLIKSMGGHFQWKKSACGKLDSSNRACKILGGHFHRKKAPAASWIAATGLVKVRIMAARWISATVG